MFSSSSSVCSGMLSSSSPWCLFSNVPSACILSTRLINSALFPDSLALCCRRFCLSCILVSLSTCSLFSRHIFVVLVMLVLIVCDLCQTTYTRWHFCSRICFKKRLITQATQFADYASFQKFLLLQVLGVLCAVLDILRSHSITKKFSLNKLCTLKY